jgi:hypothetical protein
MSASYVSVLCNLYCVIIDLFRRGFLILYPIFFWKKLLLNTKRPIGCTLLINLSRFL